MGEFQLFSFQHILTLLIILCMAILIYFFRDKIRESKSLDYTIRAIFIITMLTVEVVFYSWFIKIGSWSIRSTLPLHLCGISLYLCCYTLMTKKYKVYEIVYFWGLAGPLQALLTPDLNSSFPNFRYIHFFVSHACTFLAILYMTFVFEYRPTMHSLFKSFIFLVIYAIPVGLFDCFIEGNYLLLRMKPEGASVLDYFGPWPIYIGVMSVLMIPYFVFLYMPVVMYNRSNAKLKNDSV